jgi:hypothetical protein
VVYPEGEAITMRCSSLFQLPLLLSILSSSPAATHSSPSAGRPPLGRVAAVPGIALSPQILRRVVARQAVGNPAVAELIPRRPVLGGTWLVGSADDVRFVAPGVVALDYEDGHIAGRLVVRVVDAANPRTWVVLEDRPR